MRSKFFLIFFTLSCLLTFLNIAFADDKPADPNKALELKACGPKEAEVMFSAHTDKKNHPTPSPSDGKALVYILRPTMIGNAIQSKLAVDGEWKGVNRGNNYFFVELDPGEHFFCSRSENRSVLTLTLEAGKTYFIQQHVDMGFMKNATRLETMTEEKGREKLAKLNLATWELKK